MDGSEMELNGARYLLHFLGANGAVPELGDVVIIGTQRNGFGNAEADTNPVWKSVPCSSVPLTSVSQKNAPALAKISMRLPMGR